MDTEIEIDTAAERTQETQETQNANANAKNLEEKFEVNFEDNLWPLVNAKLGKSQTEEDLKLAMREKTKKIASFIDNQRQLEGMNTEQKDNSDEAIDAKEAMRRKLIEDGINEQQRLRREKWDRDLANGLYLMNDMKREQLTDHKLKHPIAMLHSRKELRLLDEKIASIGDMKKIMSQRTPSCELEDLMAEPLYRWGFSDLPKKSDMMEALCRIFRKNIGPTLAVVVEGKQFYCHSMLLGVMSGFFANRNYTQVLYIPSRKIPLRSFVNIYRWMLEPIQSITLIQLIELLRAAKFLGIDQLSRQCWRLAHEMLKSAGRILAMYSRSQRVCSNIEKIITPYVGRMWMPFAASRDYIHLDFRKVYRMLQLDTLAVNSEMEVMYSAILWLQVDWPARQSYAIDLMRVVRFDLMPFVFLIAFGHRRDGPASFEYLKDSMVVRKMILEALEEIRTRPDRLIGGLGSCPRQWIYDSACPYHHCKNCKAVRYASYADFASYLALLQEVGYPHGIVIKRSSDEDIVCC